MQQAARLEDVRAEMSKDMEERLTRLSRKHEQELTACSAKHEQVRNHYRWATSLYSFNPPS